MSKHSMTKQRARHFEHPLLCLWLAALLVFGLSACGHGPASQVKVPYKVENIRLPEGLTTEVGGMDFLPDGRLALAFHRGEVMLYNPQDSSWQQFADGLHDPLGVKAVSNHELLIMQRPELTKVSDTDGDGIADAYMTVTDDFGMSGNYHEFAFGPVSDSTGRLFIALNTASSGDGIWDELRGEFNEYGRPGRMYAAVPYRGWVMALEQDGTLVPWASGFRSPDGIGFDAKGRLLVTDNQGDWLGTSKLYHVEKGKHYGHVSSLAWREGWDTNPLTLSLDTLNQLRTKASVLFPHNIMSNSPTKPLPIPESANFGPFTGQLLVGEMDFPKIMRVMLEEVNGKLQGACINFLDSIGLSIGNHRMRFAPDGSLWIGSTAYVWVGDRGLQRVSYQNVLPFEVQDIHITPKGFTLLFTKPLADLRSAELLYKVQVKRFYYHYHQKYGSPRVEETDVEVARVKLTEDKQRLDIELSNLKAGYVYDLSLKDLVAAAGDTLRNNRLFYTANELPNQKPL